MGKPFKKNVNSMFCWTENLSDVEAEEERYVKKELTQPPPAKPKAPRKSKVESIIKELDNMYENMIAAIVRLRRRFNAVNHDNAEVFGKYICDQNEAQQNGAVIMKGKAVNTPDIQECSSKVMNPRVCRNQGEVERFRVESAQSEAKAKQKGDTLDDPGSVTNHPKSSGRSRVITDVGSVLITVNGDDDSVCEDIPKGVKVELPQSESSPHVSKSSHKSTSVPPGCDLEFPDTRLGKMYNPPTLDDLLDQVLEEVVTEDRRKQLAENQKRQDESVFQFCRPFNEAISNGLTDERAS